jgi:type I restriction enzyme S subunit
VSVAWPTASLGEVLSRSSATIALDPETTYKEVTVRINGKGVVERRQVLGVEIASDRRYVAKSGQFIISRIDARHGASGLISDELDGSVVTNDFPLFDVAKDRLDPAFLGWMSRTRSFVELCKRASEGTTNRVRLSEDRFKALEIPLPPLHEQRRIVARIEELAAKVEEARQHRVACFQETGVLFRKLLETRRRELCKLYSLASLGSITKVTSGGTPSRDNPAYWGGTIPWIKTGELVDGDIASAEEHITQAAVDGSSAKLFPPDTVLIALYGQGQTRGRTGRLTISATTNQACCALLPCDALYPQYLQWWLRSLYDELREDAKGGAQPNWSGGMIKDIQIALPPRNRQIELVSELDAMQVQSGAVQALQDETAAELDAMLPAILDKAFKGEL